MRTMRMEREDIENGLKVLSHIVDDDFIITVDEARKIIGIDGETIEALQKRIVSALTALHLANEKMGYYGIQPYTEADGEDMISDWVKTLVHEELKQQLPKRGEWEREMDVNDEPFYQCSVCGECFDFNSDSTHEVFNYCPNCGADMRKMEVQDGQ